MALTKHQRLARAIKQQLDNLDLFYEKVCKVLDVIQFHFYEKVLIIGRPLMTKRALKTMMLIHKEGLALLAPNQELRALCASKPLIGAVISPRTYSDIKVSLQENLPNAPWLVPWGVKIVLTQKTLQQIQKERHEALLYCASEEEMSEWIDWFEVEDQASTLVNQILSIQKYEETSRLKQNLEQLAFPIFKKMFADYEGNLPPPFQQPNEKVIIPTKDSSVSDSYEAVNQLLKSIKGPYHDNLVAWKMTLEEHIFSGLNWNQGEQNNFIKKWKTPQITVQVNKCGQRWETSKALDRMAYSSFIEYFAKRFLKNPQSHQVDGEIVCLLWIMIYLALDQYKPSLESLLNLTSNHFRDGVLLIDDQEVEISKGLAEILQAYIGCPTQRQQKLFPNLTVDRLEDRLRKASTELLPPGSVHALPEAFLTFPHNQANRRMDPFMRRKQQSSPPKVHYLSISRQELAGILKQNLSH